MGEARINAGLLPLARPIESLRCDPRNARRHAERDLAVLRQSLELHGQQKPIVALRDGKVIAGNGTLEAARSLGWERLAVVTYDDEDAAKAAAFAIVDNRSAELSEWDVEIMIKTMGGLSPNLAASVGFAQQDLDTLIAQLTPATPDEWGDAFGAVPSGDRTTLAQMSFVLTEAQVDTVKRAIVAARGKVDPKAAGNRNANGNALAWVAQCFLDAIELAAHG